MNDIKTHYSQLLGLDSSWQVSKVNLVLTGNQVVIQLEHSGGKLRCPDCDGECSRKDLAPERTWRHLDTMQFKTELKARIPRTVVQNAA